jgi:hypothetical protein
MHEAYVAGSTKEVFGRVVGLQQKLENIEQEVEALMSEELAAS